MRSMQTTMPTRPGLLLACMLAAGSMLAMSGCSDGGGDDDDASASTSPTPSPVGDLAIDPASLTFSATAIGKSSTQTLTLTNQGNGPLTIQSIDFPEDGGGAFALSADSADPSGSTLAGESKAVIVVEFRPVKTGDITGTLRIASDDPDQPTVDVGLSGTATGTAGGDEDEDQDGYTPNQGDCDDNNAAVNPGAKELCDQIDNNCDNVIDTDAEDRTTYYVDADLDNYGDANGTTQKSCTTPSGYVAAGGDCDDDDASIYPGAKEQCDGIDNDCDGQTDEEGDTPFYADADADGHGDPDVSIVACEISAGYVASSDDCDDQDPLTYAGADEICDQEDNDCNGSADEDPVDGTAYYTDADQDRYGTGDPILACTPIPGSSSTAGDCDDTKSTIHPGVSEICNKLDDDCDGQIDEDPVDGSTWYADTDGDTHGDKSSTVQACSQPTGYVATADDCDDAANNTYPTAAEPCDNVDNDCDGQVDEEGQSTIYVDADGDTYGDSSQPSQGCAINPGYASRDGDCNDADKSVNPGAAEVCDGIDQNCNGQLDEGAQTTFYLDSDGDGYGTSSQSTAACSSPGANYSTTGGDCDDASKAIYPGAAETCNGVDDDCDGQADNNATDAKTWYADGDGDGYGRKSSTTVACTAPSGYVKDSTDCNDQDGAIHPGANELCNSIDDDCDGQIDEAAVDAPTWGLDADKDGYGGLVTSTTCTAPSGYVAQLGDCNDSNPSIHPGATETCNSIDDDCDGQTDEGASYTFYLDRDGDGYGDDTTTVTGCGSPSPVYVATGGDCNDLDKNINPGTAEKCNSIDDNCNGAVDDNASDATSYYLDNDDDGFGNASMLNKSCTQPKGYVKDNTDCDDSSPTTYPGAPELCDGVDQDCDKVADNNPTDAKTYYPDVDKDGYGSIAGGTKSCTAPTGYLTVTGDCNDSNAGINPGAKEVCDGVDQNCDGQIDEGAKNTYYVDRDGDKYGDSSTTTEACSPSAFYVSQGGDCNDFDGTVYPSATEKCNGKDDNCDGTTDESTAADAKTWYKDGDGDAYGTSATSTKSCSQPSGYVSSSTDCDDADKTVNPGATELCNGKDDNCDGTTDESTAADVKTWYQDVDGDGYGTPLASKVQCTQPSGYVSSNTDCNDTDKAVNPGAAEVCNGKDDDCNGQTDEGSATDAKTWYQDADVDKYGNPNKSKKTCTQPSGYVTDNTDCDDNDASVYPGAGEKPSDARDNDCDGKIDENGALASIAGALYEHSVAYDPVRQRVLVFGGRTYYDISNAVYTLDLSGGNKGKWTTLSTSGTGPAPLYQHSAIYDEVNDRMIVYGGRGYYDLSGSVWSLSFASSENGTWAQLNPSGTAPAARARHAAMYDPIDNAMVVFGGEVYYDLSTETWTLDLNTANGAWKLRNPGTTSGAPGARTGAGVTYDTANDRMLMVGGDGFYERYGDVWGFDLATFGWTKLSPSGSNPMPPTANAVVGFFSAGKEMLVFGGESYYDAPSTLYALDFSSSSNGTWKTINSSISTPVPTLEGGGVVLEADALDTIFFGQGYYGLLDTPVSINLN